MPSALLPAIQHKRHTDDVKLMPSASDGCVALVAGSRTGRLSHWHSRITYVPVEKQPCKVWQIMHLNAGPFEIPLHQHAIDYLFTIAFYLHNTSPIRLCHNRGNGGRRGNTDVL